MYKRGVAFLWAIKRLQIAQPKKINNLQTNSLKLMKIFSINTQIKYKKPVEDLFE